ncbi:ATP-grasp domain-containing protein [Burkholderia cenocepacia]
MEMIQVLQSLGHVVSYIESRDFECYESSPKNLNIKAAIDRVIGVENIDDHDSLWKVVARLNSEEKVDGVICTAENSVEAASVIAEKLRLPFPSSESVKISRRKDLTRDVLNRNRIRNARYGVGRSLSEVVGIANRIGYPVVLKPVSSVDSVGAAIVLDERGCEVAWNTIESEIKQLPGNILAQYKRGFLVEERLTGKMVSAELVHDGATMRVFMISGRGRSMSNELEEYRIDMPADLSDEEWGECTEYATSVVDAIGLKCGIFHIEIILTSSGPVLVEVNPRVMGSYMPFLYGDIAGVDIMDLLARIHTGQKIDCVTFPKPESIGVAVRFDAVEETWYRPSDLKRAVLSNFTVLAEDLTGSEEWRPVKPGETLGRARLKFDTHAEANRRLQSFFSLIEVNFNLKLLR